MVSSVLTNNSAMAALASLNKTRTALNATQDRISSGLRVATARDNAATWAIATTMRSDISNFKQVSENLSLSASIVGTGRSAAESIGDLVDEVKAKITSAQNPAVDKRQVQADIDQLVGQISSIVDSAEFKGVNLIDTSGTQRVLGSVNDVNGVSTPTYIDVAKQDLRTEGGKLADLKMIDVTARGDDLFGDATAAEMAMGNRRVTFDKGAAIAQGTYTVNYTDAAGAAKNVTVNYVDASATDAELITALNADANFSKLFFAEAGAANQVVISAASRAVETGSFSIDSVAGSALGATFTAATASTSSTMTFKDEPLKLGETFELSYTVGGTDKKLKLQVANEANGTAMGYEADGTAVMAVNFATVGVHSATGSDIGGAIRAALTAHADFAGAANDGVELGVAGAGAVVTISTADGTDKVRNFEPPASDYKTMLAKADAALKAAVDAGAAFGSAQKRIELQKNFMDKLVDTLTSGVGAMVDADLAEEAARLQALQVQEQLGTQALSIANSAPQSILSLFR